MPEIKVLPKQVAELIAAGEVVERPASVIKELVENSIDAGSTQITVEIKNGGVTFMRVTDNGCGIERDFVATAFLRHATSKVRVEDDLNAIATLGFRGEALAAISSVSRVEMITKTKNSEIGSVYRSEGGSEVTVDDAGCPDGTTIIVRDLFFNTPARMKFLKKDVAEGTAVGAILDHIALSHPEISVKFIRDGKNVLATPGDGKLMSAIYAVCGREFASTLIPVDFELGGIRVWGYTCRPTACRPKKNAQFVFLNGRYVRSGTVAQALDVAYKNSAMVGRYPAAVLHLTVPFGAVDINVHPAKTEVRFSDDRRIFDCVHYGIKNALAGGDERPEMRLPEKSKQIRMSAEQYRQTVLPEFAKSKADPLKQYEKMISNAVSNQKPQMSAPKINSGLAVTVPKVTDTSASAGAPTESAIKSVDRPLTAYEKAVREDIQNAEKAEQESISADLKKQVLELIEDEPQPSVQNEITAVANPTVNKPVDSAQKTESDEVTEIEDEVRYIGEAFATYILVQRKESLYLIDKHAAHERMLFNRLKRSEGNFPQLLLVPKRVALGKEDYITVTENMELLLKAGFEVEDFGDGAVMVRAVPSVLIDEDVEMLILEAATSLSSKREVEIERLERLYETMSCRAAVKAGNLSSPKELEVLAKAVLADKDIMYCPHGRPVAIELKKREIEKQFGRIQ